MFKKYIEIIQMFDEEGYDSEGRVDYPMFCDPCKQSQFAIDSYPGMPQHSLIEKLSKVMKERENQLDYQEENESYYDKKLCVSESGDSVIIDDEQVQISELRRVISILLESNQLDLGNWVVGWILTSGLDSQILTYEPIKCNILMKMGSHEECLRRASKLLNNTCQKLLMAKLYKIMATCKICSGEIVLGYADILRAKFLVKSQKNTNSDMGQIQEIERQLAQTQLECKVRMGKIEKSHNMVQPYFDVFKGREIRQVVCGDYHVLFLVGGVLGGRKEVYEVWGLGEDYMGQVTGTINKTIYNQPRLIPQLLNKDIEGIFAVKQSSLAYDSEGRIYEWGVKPNNNPEVQLTYHLPDPIEKIQKGYEHYAALTKSKKFYSWGCISVKKTKIYQQLNPSAANTQFVDFSCGISHTIAKRKDQEVYGLGSNELGQIGMGEKPFVKDYTPIQNSIISGCVDKIFCLGSCSFFSCINGSEGELFYCGKHSYKKNVQKIIKQAHFNEDIEEIIHISGSAGNFYANTKRGVIYKWEVDQKMSFQVLGFDHPQRYVSACRTNKFIVAPMPHASKSIIKNLAPQTNTSLLQFQLRFHDHFGSLPHRHFICPLKCQVLFSLTEMDKQSALQKNQLFLKTHQFYQSNYEIILNEIGQEILREKRVIHEKDDRWVISFKVEKSGFYYVYFFMEEFLINSERIQVGCLKEYHSLDIQLEEQERKHKIQQKKKIKQSQSRKQNNFIQNISEAPSFPQKPITSKQQESTVLQNKNKLLQKLHPEAKQGQKSQTIYRKRITSNKKVSKE